MLIARLILLALVSSGIAAADDTDLESRVDAIFEPWNSSTTPGCAVGVIQDGQVLLSRAYGVADLEHGVLNEPSTLFEVGSVSKQFTAAAILVLARDGKLKLTDDVRKYIPELPVYGGRVEINHLLSHTSGIRDWGVLDELAGWGRTTRVMTNADALDIIVRQQQLDFMPGEEFSYTNSGFVLLAIIAERVAGQSLQVFARENLFEPLGIKSTQWRDDFRRVVSGRSIAYMRTERGYVQTMPFEDVYGDAGILTNVPDLLIWNTALTERKLGEFVAKEFERRAVLNSGRQSNYSRGLYQRTRNGTTEISHAGGIGAYRAWLARFPEHRLSVAVACNAGDPDYTFGGDYFGYQIADLFLPASEKIPSNTYLTKAEVRAGLYVSEFTGMPVKLVRNGNDLRIQGAPLTAISNDRMALKNGDQVVFVDSRRFKIETKTGNVETFIRTESWAPEKPDLDSFTGRFYSNEIGATYEIKKNSTDLVLYIEHRPEMAFKLKPVYRDSFVYDIRLGVEGALVRFYRDENGAVNELGIGWRIGRARDLRFKLAVQN